MDKFKIKKMFFLSFSIKKMKHSNFIFLLMLSCNKQLEKIVTSTMVF